MAFFVDFQEGVPNFGFFICSFKTWHLNPERSSDGMSFFGFPVDFGFLILPDRTQ
jgi:hypothetical protein